MADSLGEQVEQVLTIYNQEISDKIKEITRESMKQLVKDTRATAPKGKRNGKYRRSITADYSALNRSSSGLLGIKLGATWYVKAPEYRLTHLLVHGHATKNGGRTRENPFLHNAVEKAIPEYERKVEEALQNGR